MRSPQESVQPALPVPARTEVPLGTAVHLYPLSMAEDSGMLVAAARSSEGVGLAIETTDTLAGGVWRTIGSTLGRLARLEVPVRHGKHPYRLRLWSADGRATAVELAVVAIKSTPVTEQQLAKGVAVAPVPGIEPRTGVAAVRLDREGIFRLQGDAGAMRSCSGADVPCEASPNGLVPASESLLWLVSDLEAATQKATATRVLLPSGTDESLQFDVATARSVFCDVVNAANGPTLAIATSMSGQPGVRIVDRADVASAGPANQGMAVGPWTAAAVALHAAQPVAAVWAASGSGEPIAVRLQQLSFPPPKSEAASWGSWEATLAGVTARSLDLPAGAKRLRLSLQPHTIVALSQNGRINSVHWQGNQPFEEEVDCVADRLTILHTRDAADRVHVDQLPINAADSAVPLALGVPPSERAEVRAGLLRLDVAAAEPDAEHPRMLHVRTAAPNDLTTPVLITAGGRVVRGVDLPVDTDAGTLLIPHGPGLVLSWVDRRGEEGLDLWGPVALARETELHPPAVIALSGIVQALRFTPTEPVMLHVRTSAPVVTLLKRGAAPPEVEVHPTGTVLDAYLAEEPVQIGLRAIGGGTLTGTAEVTVSAVTAIGEGLGPEVLLPAGATRLFSFTVKQEGPVGIGVHANPDVVDCVLLDQSGKRLGSGVVQMPTLNPGTYLLALHAPPDAGPVPARPALAGVELPGTGPPEDIIRSYLKLATAPEPTPAAAAGNGAD